MSEKIDFEQMYRQLDGDFGCPPECDLCATEAIQNIILLPGEKEYLESIKFPCSKYGKVNGVDTMQINCSTCGGCTRSNPKSFFRAHRPMDCRTFPFVVLKDEEGYGLYLSNECPISAKMALSPHIISKVSWTWELLLMKQEVRDDLARLAETNQSDINQELSWSKLIDLDVYPIPHENDWLTEDSKNIRFWISLSFFILGILVVSLIFWDRLIVAGLLAPIWTAMTFWASYKYF